MNKIKLCVIYGGVSTEHDVSITSYKSIISNLDVNKYDILPIYIDKNGEWYDDKENKVSDFASFLKKVDVVFPILHGLYGEDGTIQGLFEMCGVKYVGCGILSSAIGMDKVYSKIIFDKAGIKQAKYIYVKKINDKYVYVNDNFDEETLSLDEIGKIVLDNLGYPVFVKPSNSGSSIGLNRADDATELKEYIEYASEFDSKILIEENIAGREIECSVLGNDEVIASKLGEILPDALFYSYEAKYNNANSKLVIPAVLDEKLETKIRNTAIKAYKAIDGKGLARVDFFVTDNDIYINEVNTMPGFTSISMYPKLWEASGTNYSDLLDKLIKLALEK